jgi:hypothetical protein
MRPLSALSIPGLSISGKEKSSCAKSAQQRERPLASDPDSPAES